MKKPRAPYNHPILTLRSGRVPGGAAAQRASAATQQHRKRPLTHICTPPISSIPYRAQTATISLILTCPQVLYLPTS
jgi:hypothetical protein